MLRYTGVEIGLVSDIDMYLFLRKGIRGGVSYCSNRLVKSSDKLRLIYVDANNLVRVIICLFSVIYAGLPKTDCRL